MSTEKEQSGQKIENETIIVGGGISGLMAAKAALERGEKNIRILESSDRIGGKLISGKMGAEFGGQTINMGAEFIDKDNEGIIKLAKELGVDLKPTGEQGSEMFQSATTGKILPTFINDFQPLHKAMEKLREEMEKNPELAERMKDKTAAQLLNELRDKTPKRENIGLFEMLVNFVTFSDNKVSKDIADTALAAAEKELGAKAENITAAQFLSEFSPEPDRFLASTCDFRVKDGTEMLAEKLRVYLKSKGVEPETGHRLETVQKTGEGNEKELTFVTKEGKQTLRSSKVVMALPSYALPKINWLDKSGNPDAEMAFIKDIGEVQYTKNAKFTVALKVKTDENGNPKTDANGKPVYVDIPTQGANAFLKGGENWSPDDGLLTFLVHNENEDTSRGDVMRAALENYASSFGMKAEDLFYIDPKTQAPVAGSFVYTKPGDAPCWSTPSPKNHAKMKTVFAKMEAMASQGLGFVGTYIPLPTGGVGFMECGAQAVQRACDLMFGAVREVAQEVSQELGVGHGLQLPSHAARVRAEQLATASNKGMAL